eukprot:CAMPEP_0179178996 /NCGR_PEP_ID=MMETSP0796-20121207/88571_1 /TAXON_ID=73915 /ORGANISM="Pyrodinium bahamense, Strain pbaha01" /LENGTH=76 /DNA_ID=CAMNT_0020882631 /DNA_START=14 /DNA_END=241 /DNA_ORIENTATION=+
MVQLRGRASCKSFGAPLSRAEQGQLRRGIRADIGNAEQHQRVFWQRGLLEALQVAVRTALQDFGACSLRAPDITYR